MEFVRISEDRVGAVIGKEGEVKSRIEKELGVKVWVETEEGVVKIENKSDDPLAEWKAKDVVKAISYGIRPRAALNLKKDDHSLYVVDLTDIVGRSKKSILRQKGRVIGKSGKTRAHIASLTGTSISLRGKYVAIVGPSEEALIAKEAVEALASGLPHGVVYKVLEKRCANLKLDRSIHMWEKV